MNMSEKPFTASSITALEPIFSPMISFAAESSRFMMIPAMLNLIITLFRFSALASNVFPFFSCCCARWSRSDKAHNAIGNQAQAAPDTL